MLFCQRLYSKFGGESDSAAFWWGCARPYNSINTSPFVECVTITLVCLNEQHSGNVVECDSQDQDFACRTSIQVPHVQKIAIYICC